MSNQPHKEWVRRGNIWSSMGKKIGKKGFEAYLCSSWWRERLSSWKNCVNIFLPNRLMPIIDEKRERIYMIWISFLYRICSHTL